MERERDEKEEKAAADNKAIGDWKREEDVKEKKEERRKMARGEQDKPAGERLKEQLRKRGVPPERIEAILKGKYEDVMEPASTRPTYIKVHKKYLLPETLDIYGLPWSYDRVGNLF